MAELKKSSVLKVDILTVSEFAKDYGQGVSSQAISYAMDNGIIDFVRLGRERFVVLTEKTKQYVPNGHPHRSKRSREGM